ncbi:multicopper oxidase domain-containing protein [Nocardioides sp. B-3]|uniref:multicopper oxidase domain-containing protein n=1 Tax=Nocardioides sp. B-3 TaxID=2895565 RepID=UPI00215317AF|nr:multicopper oxidase domain-containing protein [Nocardioides sp. B-3]UUZ58506.1 multicopper oxidase domain-containing protein [Nocardioides sp. B-3]
MAARPRFRLWLASAATGALVPALGWSRSASRLPDTYDSAEMGYADQGGGPAEAHAGHDGVAVADLTADPERPADVTARLAVRVEDGDYTVNGSSPGPVLEATVGDLVRVTLVNDNVAEGTTLHWHGVDVPNAADGVAGVTRDAVLPGEEFVYRFVADRPGTFWYHSHQVSHAQVRGGLFGALVIHPAGPSDSDVMDEVAVVHRYDDGPSSTVRPVRRRSWPNPGSRCGCGW